MLRLPAGAKKTKGKAFKRQSRNADDLKRIYRLFSARPGDPASTLMATEETMHIMKEQHNTEINISIGGID